MTPFAVVAGLVLFWLLLSVKVLNEYERGFIFRLGKVQPTALHLRYLQTLTDIAAEKNSTIIFPPPIDWMSFSACTGNEMKCGIRKPPVAMAVNGCSGTTGGEI